MSEQFNPDESGDQAPQDPETILDDQVQDEIPVVDDEPVAEPAQEGAEAGSGVPGRSYSQDQYDKGINSARGFYQREGRRLQSELVAAKEYNDRLASERQAEREMFERTLAAQGYETDPAPSQQDDLRGLVGQLQQSHQETQNYLINMNRETSKSTVRGQIEQAISEHLPADAPMRDVIAESLGWKLAHQANEAWGQGRQPDVPLMAQTVQSMARSLRTYTKDVRQQVMVGNAQRSDGARQRSAPAKMVPPSQVKKSMADMTHDELMDSMAEDLRGWAANKQ